MDGGFKDQGQVNFTEDQTLIVARLDAEFGRLRRETIGSWLNERQRNLITVLGSREDASNAGRQQEPLTVTKCRKSIEDAYNISDVAATNDIDGLVDAGLVEKASIEGNRKSKQVRLTTGGYEQWRAYANGRVALVLAAAQAIEEAGTTPPRFIDRIKTWVAGFLKRGPQAGIAVALCIGLTSEARANDWTRDGWTAQLTVQTADPDPLWMENREEAGAWLAPAFASPFQTESYQYVDGTSFNVSLAASFAERADSSSVQPFMIEQWMGASARVAPTLEPRYQMVDGTKFLDENLPASMVASVTSLGAQPLMTDQWMGVDAWLTPDPETRYQLVDGTKFLDENLPLILAAYHH